MTSTPTTPSAPPPLDTADIAPRQGRQFWLSIVALLVSVLLSALDISALATALPTITGDLHGSDNFVWVGSGYVLSSAAILPLSGTLADVFGALFLALRCVALSGTKSLRIIKAGDRLC